MSNINHMHYWIIENYEYGILKHHCKCGAIRFTSRVHENEELLARASELNKLKDGYMANKNIDQELIRRKTSYYLEHKDEIINDAKSLGYNNTKQKWNIPDTSFYQLMNRWLGKDGYHELRGTPIKPCEPQKQNSRKIAKILNENHNGDGKHPMPCFPDFDSSWDKEVQLCWLNTYKELVKI